jgi:hypothetical protein
MSGGVFPPFSGLPTLEGHMNSQMLIPLAHTRPGARQIIGTTRRCSLVRLHPSLGADAILNRIIA